MGTLLFYLLLYILVVNTAKYIRFRGSGYKDASGNGFIKTVFDKGNFGEYLTFLYLEKLKGHNRLMTNLYLPKEDGTTTEIDLLLLSETGIYVFESKNYSGWIYGDERSTNWTQTLGNKQKNSFYNPIWQNYGHINALKSVLDEDNDNLYKSYIIFSERCRLKKVNVKSNNVKVLKRNVLNWTIKRDMKDSSKLLSVEDIDRIYEILKKYTRVSGDVKKGHVVNIKSKM